MTGFENVLIPILNLFTGSFTYMFIRFLKNLPPIDTKVSNFDDLGIASIGFSMSGMPQKYFQVMKTLIKPCEFLTLPISHPAIKLQS